MKDIKEKLMRLGELIEKVEIPDRIGYMEQHISLFRRTEVGTVDQLREREAVAREQAEAQIQRMFIDYHNKVVAVENEFGVEELFYENSEFSHVPNGRSIFAGVYELAYKDGRDLDWIEVFKLFCKYEALVLGALRIYAEGGQGVGEQGGVEHAA